MDTFHFCEERPSDYEKTIIRLAISFGIAEVYVLDDSDITGLSNLLKIEYCRLEKALFISDSNVNHFSKIKFGDEINEEDFNTDYAFFDIIGRYYFIGKALSQISYQKDKEHLKNNFYLYKSMLHSFDMINVQSATNECIYNDKFSFRNAIYSNSDFSPNSFCDILQLFLMDVDYYENNKDFLPIIYQILSYEFYTRTNTLYLISIAQIIKQSPYFDKTIKNIADEFYNNLLFMLRDARVISVQVNSLYQNSDKDYSLRTRRTDNTTRLHVLYGYDNYDTYAIRLDLSHQGEGFVHYNNKSPGGIKCCLFNESEYKSVIQVYPAINKCFIEYGTLWALKELSNCDLNSEEKAQYENIRKNKEHDQVFKEEYTEENIIAFIDIIGNMLPRYCYVPIDKEEIHARYCFNYDRIMGGVFYLYLAYLVSDKRELEKVMEYIVIIAINYNLIHESDREAFSYIDGIYLIVESARERVFI